MKAGDTIPDELLDSVVTGMNLAPGTLRNQLGTDVTLFVFLRHFGCMFCRETLADMRKVSEEDPRFPTSIFFHQGTAIEGRAFLRRYWPDVRAIADQRAEFYEGFGVERGGLIRMLGPSVWASKSRARAKGHANGERTGDIWRMPGVFLVRGEEVVWAHEHRHAADHPDYGLISERASDARAHSR